MRPTSLYYCAVISLAAASANAQELLEAKPVAGTLIKIIKEFKISDQGSDVFDIMIGDRKLYVDRDDYRVEIQGVYEEPGHSYALIAEVGGGTACAESFRAIDISSRVLVSKSFRTCSDHPYNIGVERGELTVTLPSREGKIVVYRYGAGILTEAEQPAAYRPIGPDQAPQNDIAAYVNGKLIYDAVNLKAVAVALKKVMGPIIWAKARTLVRDNGDQDWGSAFESRGEFDLAGTCVKYFCSMAGTEWAFDHFGHAWASWWEKGKPQYFGSPPEDVKRALKPPADD